MTQQNTEISAMLLLAAAECAWKEARLTRNDLFAALSQLSAAQDRLGGAEDPQEILSRTTEVADILNSIARRAAHAAQSITNSAVRGAQQYIGVQSHEVFNMPAGELLATTRNLK